ncbi:hypothetical protein RD792_013422 [Penstemon davidsonii]|uniref:Uncharacterized protein n=1 Tax=Penstemon davidsonii TaxID=160366 RepID=A0ABR0CV56_9LAMI|nr:hypothetical protein RD792_013422 [Penstemon davidsonii]
MSQIPNLENAPINLSAIRARAKSQLENILKSIRGDKCLVIDPKLSGSLSLILPSSELTIHGAELRHLTAEPVSTERTKVVYLVRAQLDLMKFICSHIHSDTSKGLHREYHLYFVPRRLVVCEKILEEEKVHELLTIGEFPLYLIPLDEDVLSFELELAQKEYLVDGDATSLWHIAKGIHNLEFSHGVIPNVRAKGKASTQVADILSRMQAEEPVNTSDMGIPEINTLILLDREVNFHSSFLFFVSVTLQLRLYFHRDSNLVNLRPLELNEVNYVDMVTPMCTQLTYEGLVDEFLGVINGSVELDGSVMGVQQEGKKIKIPLNSSDKLFKETRDMNFEVVVQVLRQKATSMKQDYSEISSATQTVSELKDFVKKLNSLPEMTRHINLAQHLTTFTSKTSFLGRLDMEQTLVEAESFDMYATNLD